MPLLPDIFLISILVRICHLILEHLDELVEDDGKHSANGRSNPCVKRISHNHKTRSKLIGRDENLQ